MLFYLEALLAAIACGLVTTLLFVDTLAKKVPPPTQVPAEVKGWADLASQAGVAVVFLGLMLLLGWRLIKWIRPKIDVVADQIIANNNRVIPLLEAESKRDQDRTARDAVLIQSLAANRSESERTNMLLGQVLERINAQSNRAQTMSEAMLQVVAGQTKIGERITDLVGVVAKLESEGT